MKVFDWHDGRPVVVAEWPIEMTFEEFDREQRLLCGPSFSMERMYMQARVRSGDIELIPNPRWIPLRNAWWAVRRGFQEAWKALRSA